MLKPPLFEACPIVSFVAFLLYQAQVPASEPWTGPRSKPVLEPAPDSKWVAGYLGRGVSIGMEQIEKMKMRTLFRVKVSILLTKQIRLKSGYDWGAGQAGDKDGQIRPNMVDLQ